MKVKECPKCGSTHLGDMWRIGRKLQQHCYECGWNGRIRTPEKRLIKTTKFIDVGQFSGFHYEIFDRFGHTMESSRSYNLRDEAISEIKKILKRGFTDLEAGPYTAVLWPDVAEVKGEVFLE